MQNSLHAAQNSPTTVQRLEEFSFHSYCYISDENPAEVKKIHLRTLFLNIFLCQRGNSYLYDVLKALGFNPLTPKICLSILPSSYYTFPCKLIMRIWCSIEVINCIWWVWVFSLLVCCVVYEYHREKVHCNHLWELKG